MDPLYGVIGAMVVIGAIGIALTRGPRRTHAWERERERARPPGDETAPRGEGEREER